MLLSSFSEAFGFEVPNNDVVGHVMCLPDRGQYKASLYSVWVLQVTKNDSLLIKI